MMFDLKKGLSPHLHRNRPDVPQASRFRTEGQSSCVHGFLFGLPNSTWGAVSSGLYVFLGTVWRCASYPKLCSEKIKNKRNKKFVSSRKTLRFQQLNFGRYFLFRYSSLVVYMLSKELLFA